MEGPSFKDAVTICKSIMRNGYDAHIVNTPLQEYLINSTDIFEIDLCTDTPPDELVKMFQHLEISGEDTAILGVLREEEDGCLYRFYRMNQDTVAPEDTLTRITPTMATKLALIKKNAHQTAYEPYPGFIDVASGAIQLAGLPAQTLRDDYLLGIRAMRLSAKLQLPIEQNTWVAIVAASQKIIDHVSTQQIMDEWRAVSAEHMWLFVQLLFDSHILHALIPEVACLAQIRQTKNDTGVEESVFEHTIASMFQYPKRDEKKAPETSTHDDWLGTFTMMFHDVGKPYTAEFCQGKWTFYQHHLVGAKVTRVILRRLRMSSEEIEQVCNLVRNHMRFQFMMTDKGIRRFKAQDDYERLIAMAKASLQAREDNYTAFNHNNKYLKRADEPEQMLEPFLNGNEIMEVTGLAPGMHVGFLRQALLQAQKDGKVTTMDEAVKFVCSQPIPEVKNKEMKDAAAK